MDEDTVVEDFTLSYRSKDARNKKNARKKSMEKALESPHRQVRNITWELAKLKLVEDQQKKQINALKIKNRENAGQWTREISALKSENARLNFSNTELKAEIKKFHSSTIDLNTKIKSLQDELSEACSRTEVNQIVTNYYSNIQHMNNIVVKTQKSVVDTMQKHSKLGKIVYDELMKAGQTIKELQAELEGKEDNEAFMEERIAELERKADNDKMKHEVEIEALKTIVDDLVKKNSTLLHNEKRYQKSIVGYEIAKQEMNNNFEKHVAAENALKKLVAELDDKYCNAKRYIISRNCTILRKENQIADLVKHEKLNTAKMEEALKMNKHANKELTKRVRKLEKEKLSVLKIKEEPSKPEFVLSGAAFEPQKNLSFYQIFQQDKEDDNEEGKRIALDQVFVNGIDHNNVLNGKIIIVESMCPLMNDETWEAYSMMDCSDKPVKISLKDAKFKLQLHGRLNVSDIEMDVNALLQHVHSCKLVSLRLVDQFISKDNFVKLISSQTIKNFVFYRVTVADKNDADALKLHQILMQLPNVEKFEYWFKADEVCDAGIAQCLAELKTFKNLRSFSLCNLSPSFDMKIFQEFITKNSNVNFTLKFNGCIPNSIKHDILSMKNEYQETHAVNGQLNIAFV